MNKMNKLIAITILVLTPFMFGFTASWDPVTQYTDNTLIGPEAGGVFYDLEMDGSVVVSKTPATSLVLPAVPKKSSHVFRAMTVLGTGDNSVWSPPFPWTAPAGNPLAPGQFRVNP
jgi:hypothetical protein